MEAPAPTLRVLGGAVVLAGDEPLGGPAAHRHRIAILALLAAHGRVMSRDKLIGYLWPDRDTEHARNLLKTAVHELRKVVGENAIRSTGDQLSLDTSLLPCDVVDFEAAVAAKDFTRAAALYGGPFLDGFFLKDAHEFEHWVDAQRARLAAMHERVIRALADVPEAPSAATPAAPARAPSPPSVLRRLPWARLTIGAVAVAALISVAVAAERRRDTEFAILANNGLAGVQLPDDSAGSAMQFNGDDTNVSTRVGTLVTTQLDNIIVDMMVRYEGPAPKPPTLIFYNGHGAVTGWGLIVLGRMEAQPEGTIGVLAGGITLTATSLIMKQGIWQHLTAERREGRVIVTLDDKSYNVGLFPVNPVQVRHRAIEQTSIGGAGTFDKPTQTFRGAIDRVRIRDLASNYFIDRWNFDEGAGPTTMGAKGHELFVGKSRWIPGERRSARDVYWSRLDVLCSHAYRGTLVDGTPADSAFRKETVILHVARCTPTAIRGVLHVGADRSRSFVIARTPTGLSLTHEVHAEDGSEVRVSRYGGASRDSGAIGLQAFPPDARTVSLLPESRGAAWRIGIEPRQLLSYEFLNATRRFRLEFDLTGTVASPPPAWGASR